MPKPPPPRPFRADPFAVPEGVALGVTPLVVAPLALLAGGRSLLQNTQARREKIQEEMAIQKRKEKAKMSAVWDVGGLTKAFVSSTN